MRIFTFLLIISTQLLFGQKDTIGISDLDQRIFKEPLIQHYLFNANGVRPINFFYSNIFKYKNKPFTGVATETRNSEYYVIELNAGRILRLTEYSQFQNHLLYVFNRVDQNNLLAVDSVFSTALQQSWTQVDTLFTRNAELRITRRSEDGSLHNGKFEKCRSGKMCTDDGWSTFDVADGHYASGKDRYSGWTEFDYVNGSIVGPVIMFYPTGEKRAIYLVDEQENPNGNFVEYWTNGRIMNTGDYAGGEQIGRWDSFDSLGNRIQTDWYSWSRDDEEITEKDSSLEYYPNGQPKKFIQEFWFRPECITVKGRIYIDQEWASREITTFYYENGKPSDQLLFDSSPCMERQQPDTTLWSWYPSGNPRKFIFSNHTFTEYYSNGVFKQRRNTGYPRTGEVVMQNEKGVMIVDRTYDDGLLTMKRDTSPAIMPEQLAISNQLHGCAAASLYPTPFVDLGGSSFLTYFKARLPGWKEELYIPEKVIDSMSLSLASVFLDVKDSFLQADSLLSFSKEFNPAPGEWYYTIDIMSAHPVEWLDSCYFGKLVTDNKVFNEYIRSVDYSVISFQQGFLGSSKGEVNTTTVIRTKQALNFFNLHRFLTGCYENLPHVFCGRRNEYCNSYFQVYVPCNGAPDSISTDLNYCRVNVVTHHPVWTRLRYNAYSYVINSDQTADRITWPAIIRDEQFTFEGW